LERVRDAQNHTQSGTEAKPAREPWIIRTYAGFGDARQTNQRFRENLSHGQRGLSIAFDLPTQNGCELDAASKAPSPS
jgi:ethylmalonyl-CoA mutase